MIRLFKKVKAKKMPALTPECYSPYPLKTKRLCFFSARKGPRDFSKRIKEPQKIAQKEKVPRYLTRTIILKLNKKRPINNALAFSPKSLVLTPQVLGKDQGDKRDRFSKNINSLKKRTPMSDYIINTKPLKVLQKKTTLIGVFDRTFLKIKPFFKVLQKFTSLLLKKNLYLVREAYPFIYVGLKGASTIGGFKKVLYNKILVQERKLKPAYNRRKHNITHYMVVKNQFARLDKAFVYLGKNKLASMLGLVLKTAYSAIPDSWVKTKKYRYFNNKQLVRAKAIPSLVSIIEGHVTLLLWRNQFSSSLTKSRQDRRQGVLQNLNVVCKNNTAVLLKE